MVTWRNRGRVFLSRPERHIQNTITSHSLANGEVLLPTTLLKLLFSNRYMYKKYVTVAFHPPNTFISENFEDKICISKFQVFAVRFGMKYNK